MTESKKESKLYTQTEISRRLNVSQATVTRMLRRNGFKPVKIKGRSKLFNEQQINQMNLSLLHEKEISAKNVDSSNLSIFLQKEIERLHKENSRLQNQYQQQLDSKDKQISDLNERLKESHQLQLGLERKLQMFPDNPNKAVLDGQTVSEKSLKTKEKAPEEPKRGFWSRLFH